MKCSRARVDKQGSDSIQTTQRRQNGIDGVRQDTILVIEGERPFHPDRDVLRKTEILGTGICPPRRKKTEKSDGVDDGQ